MRPEQWQTFKKAAKGQSVGHIPLSLIIDSPWLPGHVGIRHLDYYLDPEAWFQANRRVIEEFPDVIFFPSWWVEYGMAIEPSAMGTRIRFWPDQTPSESHMLFHLEDLDQLSPVDPHTDGMMALALHRYRTQRQRIADAGYTIPVVTARGPLCVASFFRGLTEFTIDLLDNPKGAHRLLEFTTRAIIAWLKAQAEVVGESIEGIFILDDVVGMIGPDQYREFAHPYLKRICDAFPTDWVKVYHNDANIRPFLEDLAEVGFDVLNWGKDLDVAEVRRRMGPRMCLMGNVNPLEIGVRGTPEQVKAATLEVLVKSGGERIILSLGGGVSPGMPAANIRAMIRAMREFNGSR